MEPSPAEVAGDFGAIAVVIDPRLRPDGHGRARRARDRLLGTGRCLRRGLATAAAAALVDAAFGLPGVDGVEIVYDEANVASSGVPRKLGFTEIARRPHPDGPQSSGESGTDVVWRLTR